MNIGFDVSQTADSKAGCGFYADQLIRALAKIDRTNEYTLLPWFYDYRPVQYQNATTIIQDNFKSKLGDYPTVEASSTEELDIIHSNNFRYPYGTRAKKIVTMYDVCFLEYPEYTTEENRVYCYRGTFDSMLFADKIVAISQYTKERLLYFFPHVDAGKVEVIHCGNRDTLLLEENDNELLSKFYLEKDDYYLSVGTIEPRKNYHTLLLAYAEYKKNSTQCKKLCIAGGYGWMEENFKKEIETLGLQDYVIVTGYVSDKELANLYRYCFSFIYPSWYEGFGLPVLEAMNFKKPVIASNVTSIPEITGEAAILINPKNSRDIVDGMFKLEENSDFYAQLARDGHQRTGRFSWEKSAQKILNLYKEL